MTVTASNTLNPPVEVRRGPRWIKRRVQTLDPQRDYTEIVKLGSLFHVNDFVLDWAFTTIMCRATNGHSAVAINREGTGKLVTTAGNRFDDTTDHFLVWNEFGPDAPETKRSVDIINALHAKYQKLYPSAFDDLPLWVYVIAWEVAGLSILAEDYLGLPKLDPKQREARAVWGRKLAESFTYIDGGPLSDVMPHLETFEDFVAFVHEYESQPWVPDANTKACHQAVLDKYAQRNKRLPRPLTDALVTTFWHDGQFECNGIERPSPFWRAAAKNYMRAVLIGTQLKPSPKESAVEKMLREAREQNKRLGPIMRSSIRASAAADETPATSSAGCPMGFGMVDDETTEKESGA
ncbi:MULTISPECIES: hypothetical protein [unclassified Rhodococcus (in: high G+C Gram-positive bacteria)]|uniref:hypothetical protein n=1 Tax=unclassified Rhodococcus (in: high G+C Gram-positive bacteria) TaxID=192944 RepID=UPI00163AA725|nr:MULTISPECIES: hypothetical protein [unclassified Rhodococcus (in: high G+C Gram-positive bacteria)]MBC2638199.1 hypothetical protein [Rhodococcus sp. 3A]MBC2897058.1 hypothetical protein [Rhodococcus sp. 4CII]